MPTTEEVAACPTPFSLRRHAEVMKKIMSVVEEDGRELEVHTYPGALPQHHPSVWVWVWAWPPSPCGCGPSEVVPVCAP